MSVLAQPILDRTDRDFDALRARLIALVRSVFPDWTDFDVAGFGNILIDMFAFVGDVLAYYQDAQARESRLATATQRRNVIALARMLGYRLRSASAATAIVRFTLDAPPRARVTVPAGTVVRTQEVTEPVRYQLLSDVSVEAGQAPPVATGIVEHSESHVRHVDTRGLAGTDVTLDRTPYLDGSAVVLAANGRYEEVSTLLDSSPTDRHYVVLVDQEDRATLRFGGAPPTGTVRITYRTGGGTRGNVDANRIVVLEGAFTDAHGRPARVAVTNPAPATGGAERESVASARLRAPESLRALTRTVSREDFEINARRVPGVARALMLTSNEDSTIAENSGVLYVIPEGGGMPTPALKNAVRRQVTEVQPCTLTFQVSVQDPAYKVVNVEARVFLREGHAPATVRDRLRASLADLFRIARPDGTPNADIGFGLHVREVAWSDVFNAIRDTEGVRKIGDGAADLRLNGLPRDVVLRVHEFPVLGTVAAIDAATGAYL
jgi:uncharacterized phage protein gp47/JayE